MFDDAHSRQALWAACQAMVASPLHAGTSGNLSLRCGDGLLITPSGIPFGRLTPADLVWMDLDGAHRHRLLPSSEWRMHCDVYRSRAEVEAVVHAHPVHATALAIRRMAIPPLHYMVAAAGGGDIPCAPYATYGSPELSAHALQALSGRRACLLANHGILVVERSLERALWLAQEVEALAHQYILSLGLGGPVLLSEAQIAEVLAKFADYGLQTGSAPGRVPAPDAGA